MLKNKLLIAGSVLLLLAGLYRVFLSPLWLQRIPPGWQYDMRFVGTQTNAAPGADTLPTEDVLSQYHRTVRVISDAARPDSVVVRDRYLLTEIGTGKVQYDFLVEFLVDPRTGEHVEYPGEIFVFPRGTEKKTYRIRSSYLKGVPLRFMGEEDVENLNTYLFGFTGRAEYTEFYEGIVDGRKLDLPEGQEVRCAHDMFRYRAWVEPKTGTMVRVDESCVSGDYAYDKASGEQLYPLDRFAGVTEGDDLARLVDAARIARLSMIWLGQLMPVLLALAGAICLFGAFRRGRPTSL